MGDKGRKRGAWLEFPVRGRQRVTAVLIKLNQIASYLLSGMERRWDPLEPKKEGFLPKKGHPVKK